MVDADSPHLVPQTKLSFIACAEHDEYVPLEIIEQVSTEIEQSGVNGRVDCKTHHGFAWVDLRQRGSNATGNDYMIV